MARTVWIDADAKNHALWIMHDGDHHSSVIDYLQNMTLSHLRASNIITGAILVVQDENSTSVNVFDRQLYADNDPRARDERPLPRVELKFENMDGSYKILPSTSNCAIAIDGILRLTPLKSTKMLVSVLGASPTRCSRLLLYGINILAGATF